VSPSLLTPVVDAIVLAAGNGDRFNDPQHRSKLLHEVQGRPLVLRTLTAARDAGLTTAHVILGYAAADVRRACEEGAPSGLRLVFHLNGQWQLENGVSVLAARGGVPDRFAVLMGDHVFDSMVLARMRQLTIAEGDSLLAIDRRLDDPALVEEATKVLTEGDRIVAIGKDLRDFDALDTGLFICHAGVFDALADATHAGDTTLSGGIRRLAAAGRMRAMVIGDARWFDIDTRADLEAFEAAAGTTERVA
jgi:1L-myo-inositol 1-phosphate cytidylyltransferase